MYVRACVRVFDVSERETEVQTEKQRENYSWTLQKVSHVFLLLFINHTVGLFVSVYSDAARSLQLSIMSELKDCPPLKYYDFKPVEHIKACPRYSAVLGRSEEDGIGIEELDTLQLELETLLSSASRRLRALEEQRQVKEDDGNNHPLLPCCGCFFLVTQYPSLCLRSSQTGRTRRGISAS